MCAINEKVVIYKAILPGRVPCFYLLDVQKVTDDSATALRFSRRRGRHSLCPRLLTCWRYRPSSRPSWRPSQRFVRCSTAAWDRRWPSAPCVAPLTRISSASCSPSPLCLLTSSRAVEMKRRRSWRRGSRVRLGSTGTEIGAAEAPRLYKTRIMIKATRYRERAKAAS